MCVSVCVWVCVVRVGGFVWCVGVWVGVRACMCLHAYYSGNARHPVNLVCSRFHSAKCQELYQKMQEAVGRVNIYDIYEPCIISGVAKEPRLRVK